MSWDGSAQSFDQLFQTTAWRTVLQQFVEFVAPEASDLVLDVASRSIRAAMTLSTVSREVQCVDDTPDLAAVADKALKLARIDNVIFEPGILTDLSFADGSFDISCTILSLHRLHEPLQGLRELTRVTRTGGRVACLCPTADFTRETLDRLFKKHPPVRTYADGMAALLQEIHAGKLLSEDDLADLFGALEIGEIEIEVDSTELFFFVRGNKS